MLTREPGEFEGVRRARATWSPRINSNKAACIFQTASVPTCVRPAIRVCVLSTREIARSTSPRGHNASREMKHCADAGVLSEAEGQIVVATGLEQGERAFKMIARLAILAGEPEGDPGGAMGDSGLGRIGFRLDVAEERRRVRPHRRQLATNVAADP